MVIVPQLLADARTTGHRGEICQCRFTRDGKFVLSSGWDGRVLLWEVQTGARISEIEVTSRPLTACASSPDGSKWLVGSMNGRAYQYDAVSHEMLSQEIWHTRPISRLAYSLDGRWMMSASWDREIALRSLVEKIDPVHLHGHGDLITGCQFSADAQYLLSWSHDRSVRLWSLETFSTEHEWTDHNSSVTAAAISPDSQWIISAGRDGIVLVHDVASRTVVGAIEQKAEVCDCFFLPGGKHALTVDVEGRAIFFHLPDLSPLKQLSTKHPLQSADLSPLGTQLALACKDGLVRFVQLEGIEEQPLRVIASSTDVEEPKGLGKLLGRATAKQVSQFDCPTCAATITRETAAHDQVGICPKCQQQLHFCFG